MKRPIVITAFVIAVLGARIDYRIAVKGLTAASIPAAARAYRAVLEREGCRVLNERKSFTDQQVTLVFRAPRRVERQRLEQQLQTEVPAEVRGAVDWDTE